MTAIEDSVVSSSESAMIVRGEFSAAIKSILHRSAVAKQGLRAVFVEYDAAKVELENVRADIDRQKADAAVEIEAMRTTKAAEFHAWEMKIERLASIAANLENQIAATQRQHDGLLASVRSIRAMIDRAGAPS